MKALRRFLQLLCAFHVFIQAEPVRAATSLPFDTVIEGTLTEPGETDEFRFEASPGKRLYYDLQDPDGEPIYLRITSPAGPSVLDLGPGRDYGPFTLLNAGTHTLTLDAPGDAVGDYRFRLLDLDRLEALRLGSGASSNRLVFSGTLDPRSRSDVFVIEGRQGQRLDLRRVSSSGGEASWYLYAPDDRLLAGQNILNHLGEVLLETPGRYVLVVEGILSGAGSVSYTVQALDISDSPVAVSGLGAVWTGTVTAGTTNRHPFTAPAGRLVYLDARPPATSGLVVDLRDSSAQPLWSVGVGGDYGPYPLPRSGDYRIEVRGGNATATGDYQMRLIDLETASPLPLGETVGGEVAAGEVLAWRIDGVAGRGLLYDALDSDYDNVAVRIWNPGRTIAHLNQNSDSDSGPFALATTGAYYLVIDNQQATATDYRFRLFDLQSQPALELEREVSGELAAGQTARVFRHAGVAGERLFFDGREADGPSQWVLYGPSLQAVASSGLNGDFEFTTSPAGTYTLVLSATTAAAVRYKFQVTTPPTVEQTLQLGALTRGDLSEPSTRHVFSFEGAPGQRLFYDALEADYDNISVQLTAPSGQLLLNQNADSDGGPLLLVEPGRYSLTIVGGGATVGDYAFTLSTADQWPVINPDTVVSNRFENGYASSLYRISGQPGDTLFFDGRGNGGGSWTLFGPNNERAWGGSGWNGNFEATLTASGTHVLLLQGGSATPVSFDNRVLRTATTESVLLLGETVRGTIAKAGNRSVFYVTGRAGQRLYYDALDLDYDNISVFLTTPSGQLILNQNADSDGGPITLAETGLFRLIIDGGEEIETDYAFRLLDVLGDQTEPLRFDQAYGTGLVPVPSTQLSAVGSYIDRSLRDRPDQDDWRQSQTVAGTRRDATIHFTQTSWGSRASVGLTGGSDDNWENFSVQWDGQIRVAQPGTHLYTRSDDGSRLWIDLDRNGAFAAAAPELVDNNWGSAQGARIGPGSTAIAPGEYTFRMQYEEANGGNEASLLWDSGVALDPGASVKFFRFEGAAGARYFFDSLWTGAAGTWWLYGPQNQRLGGTSLNSDFELELPVTGTYILLLAGDQPVSIPYSFRVVPFSLRTQPLPIASVVTDTIATPGDQRAYTFDARRGQILFYDALEADYDAIQVRLIDPTGRFVFDQNSDSDIGPFLVTADGPHTLVLDGWNDTVGDYKFRLIQLGRGAVPELPLDTPLGLRPVPAGALDVIGSYVNSSLRSYEPHTDWRQTQRIAGTRRDTVLDFPNDGWGSRVELGLTEGTDANWDSFSVQWDGTVSIQVPGSRLYTRSDDGSQLWVDIDGVPGFSDSATEYVNNGWGRGQGATTGPGSSALPAGRFPLRIQYEEGSGANTFTLLNDNAERLRVPYGIEFFRFSGNAGERYFLHAIGHDTAGSWILYGPNQAAITSANLTSSAEIILPLTGEYHLALRNDRGTETLYGVRWIPSPTVTAPLILGNVVTGELRTPGALHEFTFQANANTRVFLDTQEDDTESLYIRLLTPSGQTALQVAQHQDWGPVTLAETGLHRLLVAGYASAIGDYRLRLINIDSLTPTPVGPLAGTLNPRPEADLFALDARAGQRLQFKTGSVSSPDAAWYLWSPVNQQLAANGIAGDLGTVVLPSDGRYVLGILGGQAQPDPLTYDVQLLDISDPPTGVANLGTPLEGEIAAGQTAAFNFTAPAGRWLYIDALITGGSLMLDIHPLNPTNSPVLSVHAGSDSGPHLVPRSGNYVAIVRGNSPTATGPFSLRLLDLTAAPELSLSRDIEATLPPNGVTPYRFTGTAGQRLIYDAIDADFDPVAARIIGPNGQIVYLNQNADSDSGPFTLATPGTHVLLLDNQSAAGADYRFRLWDLNAAPPVPLAQAIQGTLDPGRGMRVFRLDAQTATRFVFLSNGTAGGANWVLYNPLNQWVGGTGVQAPFEVTISQSGAHVLILDGQSPNPVPYDLLVRPSVTTEQSLTFGEPQSGSIETLGDRVAYVFQANAGQRFFLDSQDYDNDQLFLQLLSPSSQIVHINHGAASDVGPFTLTDSGTYRLLVYGSLSGRGDYRFVLRAIDQLPELVLDTVFSNRFEIGRTTLLYRYSGTAGERLFFDGLGPAGGSWYLYSPNNEYLGGSGWNGDFELVLSRNGTYVLSLDGGADTPVEHTVRVRRTRVDRLPLALGQPTTGIIERAGDLRIYEFEALPGQRFVYDALDADYDAVTAVITGPSGAYVPGAPAGNADSDSAPFTITEAGVHRITLDGSGETAADFSFILHRVDSQPLVTSGQLLTGALQPGQASAVFRLQVEPGIPWFFDGRGSNSGGNWTLYGPANNWLGAANLIHDFEPATPTPGQHVLVLAASSPQPVPYEVRPLQITELTQTLALGTSIRSVIANAGERHVYTFAGAPGQRLYYDALDVDYDGVLVSLFNPTGNLILHGNASDNREPITLNQSGLYRLVLDPGGDALGDYAFRVLDLATQPVIALDRILTSEIDPGQSTLLYRFPGVAGQHLFFDALGSTASGAWYLYSPINEYLAGQAIHADMELTLTRTGTHALMLAGNHSNAVPFSVRILSPNDDTGPTPSPPTLSDIPNQTLAEDTQSPDIPFSIGDLETPAANLIVFATSSNPALLPSDNLTFGGSGANRTIRIRPLPDQFGTAVVTVSVADATGQIASDDFLVTVTSINDPPRLSEFRDLTATEGEPTVQTSFTVADPETPAERLLVTATSSNPALLPDSRVLATSGSNQRTLLLSPVPGQIGSTTLRIQVTDADGASAVATFVLTVVPVPPFITQQPNAQTVTASGQSRTFEVVAGGTPPLSYQWRRNGQPIAGATSPSLTLNNIGAAEAGLYSVVVSSPHGLTTSTDAALTVVVPPTITLQPQNQGADPGASVTFTVAATGNLPLAYQWRRNGVNIPGATAATFTLQNVQPEDSGSYSVSVDSATGATTSTDATLSVQLPGLVLADNFANRTPLDANAGSRRANNFGATLEPGEPRHAGRTGGASLWASWTAPGPGLLSLDTRGSAVDTLLAVYTGNALANLVARASDEDSGGFFSSALAVSVTGGTEYAIALDGLAGAQGAIVLTWSFEPSARIIPQIVTQPANQTASDGGSATFSVVAINPPPSQLPLFYQWLVNGLEIPGATSSSLTLSRVQTRDIGSYTVRIGNGDTAVLSQPATLQVNVTDTGAVENRVSTEDKLANSLTPVGPAAGLPGLLGRLPGQPGPDGGLASGYSGTQIFSTTGSTTETGEPNHCAVIGGASQWWVYQAESSGTLTVSTEGSDFDTVLAIYTGDPSSFATLQLAACDNNGGRDGRTSLLRLPATAGTVYYIAVDGVAGASGNAQLTYRLATPLVIESVSLANGTFGFQARGGLGGSYRIDASTDLIFWIEAARITAPTATLQYQQPTPTLGARYYRVVSLP